MKIVKAVQTCFGCPSQWDAWTDEGYYVYLRFRWGHGTASLYYGGDADDVDLWQGPDEFLDFRTDHPLDGVISLLDFCERAGIELEL